MCGIAGIVSGPGSAPAREEDAAAMAATLRHRGPDRTATWASPDGRCAFGHSRLGVIDLVSGDQPMATPDGSVHVVFNGEVYNHRELRRELEGLGHRFVTRSDTEVLLHGYRAWGSGLPGRLEGMFAFAIWDAPAGRLFAARDRAGEKPFFWARAGARVAFASEPKALLALPWIRDDIDERALGRYLAFGYVPGPETFRAGLSKLEPASTLVVADGAVGIDRYWRLGWRAAPATSVHQARAELRRTFTSAVEARLEADVPLGAFLSGGVDSTLVVAAMTAASRGPVKTFSLGFPDDPTYDETAFAREAARILGTEHTEFAVDAGSVELVDELLDAFDEPFGDSSAIPTYLVSALARAHVTVALTGDGGDELFCGYPRLVATAAAERLPGWAVGVGARLARALPHRPGFRHPFRRAQRFFRAAAAPPAERLLAWAGTGLDPAWILRPERRDAVLDDDVARSLRTAWSGQEGATALARAMATTFASYLPDDLLVKADRCSMAHGLELRAPFLDSGLMERAASLPDRWRVRGGSLKWLLRTAFADVLPPGIARRGKQGFGVPLPLWFRTRWRGLFEERVLAPDARVREWLDAGAVGMLWAEHQGGRSDHGHALWAILTLESWLRRRGT